LDKAKGKPYFRNHRLKPNRSIKRGCYELYYMIRSLNVCLHLSLLMEVSLKVDVDFNILFFKYLRADALLMEIYHILDISSLSMNVL
jgi:hypothetical protein